MGCGRLPESGVDLPSQPTISRLENTPDQRALIAMSRGMVDLCCKSHPTAPKAITLDIDDTADIVHGHQQMSLFKLASDRTSCRSPLANQMRLILHTAGYWLMRTLRDAIPKLEPLASGEFSTIWLRLLKVAVRVRETASRIKLGFVANCPDAALFRDLVGLLIPRPT
jgi:hypothetical protein